MGDRHYGKTEIYIQGDARCLQGQHQTLLSKSRIFPDLIASVTREKKNESCGVQGCIDGCGIRT
jgi:hypothetical protein